MVSRAPQWPAAVIKVEQRLAVKAFAPDLGSSYAEVYMETAAMVVDVVASHQRYESVVVPLVDKFKADYPGPSLTELADLNPAGSYGLPDARWATIRNVAKALTHSSRPPERP